MIPINKSLLVEGLKEKSTFIKGELFTDDLENILQIVRNSDLYTDFEKETFFK